MKGDFSRDSHQPGKGFSRVLLQQGRVLLDADWNEQTAILLDYIRTLVVDLVGPHFGPADDLGFAIYSRESDTSELPAESQAAIRQLKAGNVMIGPGRYYVRGVPCVNSALTPFHMQPGRVAGPEPTSASRLFYLEVWERHVSANEDPSIQEVGLGGLDTATRAQVVWQVRSVEQQFLDGRTHALNKGDSGEPYWRSALNLPASRGTLEARAVSGESTSDLCELPADARYRGLENRLYRVEVHRGGEVVAAESSGTARARAAAVSGPEFKWSRDNGALAVPVEALPETSAGGRARLRVASLGRDAQSGFVVGCFVELTDDESELGPGDEVGPLAEVYEVDALERTVEVAGLGAARFEPGLRPLLRRWDGHGPITAGAWLSLEDGIQVRFGEGTYRAGDYWLIPARAGVPGDVLWPRKGDAAEALPPHGVTRLYAPLALISADNVVTDLRCVIEGARCVDPNPPLMPPPAPPPPPAPEM